MNRRGFRWLAASLVSAYVLLWVAYAFAALPFPSPVDGVPAARIPRTFHAPRPGGRHEGVDVFAPHGTPVRSVGWGVVVKIETQPRGGRVVLVAGRGALLVFYAHLDAWAPGLAVGSVVREGDLLGYVGDTGNARGVPHLHFEARPLATALAPVDPIVILGPRRPGAAERVGFALSEIGERR